MKKKLVNHAIEIITNPNGYKSLPYQYPNGGGGVYVSDTHRILPIVNNSRTGFWRKVDNEWV